MESLKGKIVLITGASSGIGAETARYFASCKVKGLGLVGRNKEGLEDVSSVCSSAGVTEILTLVQDLSDSKACRQVVEMTAKHFGRLDILVNSAGILINGSTETLSEEDFDKCMNINCKSAFVLTQACLPYLLETKGNIVHVSSVTGLRAFPNVVAYNMSKAAVDQLTRTCALEVASKGVRVNAVNPGVIKTDIHKRSGMVDEKYEAFLEHCKTTHAMGRAGTVDEVAKAIAFLASDAASFITGQTLAIDGGRSIMCPR